MPNIYGNDSSCTNGVGGVKANDVYFLSFKVLHEGCFIEVLADKAMPVLVANKIPNDRDPVQSCTRAAWKKGFTKVFGLRNGGKCWSGNNADSTYNKHGVATGACGSGGGHLKMDVYRFDMSVPTTSVPQATLTPTVITPTTQGESKKTDHAGLG
ncbi:uncharacterized protein LOC116293503 [Actinia tenebrosa]|uniref:Uncharacterized protein LOC116293503 n=1 Tax=Actinia tenebrosa TaxID=6105 RepID=A0A6P8HP24_ACTTE|nr:uncharacterized protein LOC116293503 [Actinia tenebrosa]